MKFQQNALPLENDELNTIWKSALKYYKVINSQKDYIPPEQFTNDSWDKLIPLDEVVLPSFPIDALPDLLKNYISDVAESTQTPIDMAGVSISVLSRWNTYSKSISSRI